jgi:hypothetical protein
LWYDGTPGEGWATATDSDFPFFLNSPFHTDLCTLLSPSPVKSPSLDDFALLYNPKGAGINLRARSSR